MKATMTIVVPSSYDHTDAQQRARAEGAACMAYGCPGWKIRDFDKDERLLTLEHEIRPVEGHPAVGQIATYTDLNGCEFHGVVTQVENDGSRFHTLVFTDQSGDVRRIPESARVTLRPRSGESLDAEGLGS